MDAGGPKFGFKKIQHIRQILRTKIRRSPQHGYT
jgi:hypothetical protein